MIQFNFITHTTKELLDLRGTFIATLNNPACAAIFEPVSDTIRQINKELEARGIYSIKTTKQ